MIPAQTVASIYDVPVEFQKYSVAEIIGEKLKLRNVKPDMKKWEEGRKRHDSASGHEVGDRRTSAC